MAVFPGLYYSQAKLESEIERVKQKLGPEVVRVRHSIGPNTRDEPAITFRIVLADSAIREEILGEVAQRITWILREELHPNDWGLMLYTRFRGQSEQAAREHLDLEWA